jgi:hypothetical protein
MVKSSLSSFLCRERIPGRDSPLCPFHDKPTNPFYLVLTDPAINQILPAIPIIMKRISCLFLILFSFQSYIPVDFKNMFSAVGHGHYFNRPSAVYDPPKQTTLPVSSVGFALVELFTSEGCSSCPPADEAVGKINTINQHIYILSFHVDYWDYLGWKDPYSNAAYSERQREYGNLFHLTGIYTPQIIINGKTEFVGSDETRLQESIAASLKGKPGSALILSLDRSGNKITIHCDAGAGDGIKLNLALVQLRATDFIQRGENKGKTLHHSNIVRDFQTIDSGNPGETYYENIPAGAKPADFEIVAFLQKAVSGEIISAARAAIP